ncbi:MAG: oxidoreductase family/hexapeptide repeat-containing acetyltransferase [Candidatus Angelobacter sp.]|nr:oxidoreductase family/hexapeptide repeat-containing acetyltransferase [Candidatus Angelobacter sp.]
MVRPNIAVIGCGYWGKNVVRTFHNLGALRCVCDVRSQVLDAVREKYGVQTTSSIAEVLADPQVEGVAIAAPAVQHYQLVRQALEAGKHVLVEKPLALHLAEGRHLAEIADSLARVLMVGHILQYHPAILKLKEMISAGELGRIKYIYSSRLNLGKLRAEENILWSFAPHDISAVLYLLDEMPTLIASHGGTYIDSRIADTTLSTCQFASGVNVHIFVSWLHPFKEQKLTIVGGKKMAVFDDMQPESKLVLYSHRIDWVDRIAVARNDQGQVVPIAKGEPLGIECEHFLECMSEGKKPRTDAAGALQVLEVLDACERSLSNGRRPDELKGSERDYFADQTAVNDPGVKIGCGTKIWHFSHIMQGAKVGGGCNFGQNVVISPGVIVGNNVKIQNNVSVYTGVELEDDVFCGPSMVFTNVINPRSHIIRKHEYRRTLVKRGASIGANATVVCGITLGEYCFVAAGAVVTRDVPDYALVMGIPAEQVGSMCYCGTRLPDSFPHITCAECGRTYLVENSTCKEISVQTPPKVALPNPVAA